MTSANADHIKNHGHIPAWLPGPIPGTQMCVECGRVYDVPVDLNNQAQLVERK